MFCLLLPSQHAPQSDRTNTIIFSEDRVLLDHVGHANTGAALQRSGDCSHHDFMPKAPLAPLNPVFTIPKQEESAEERIRHVIQHKSVSDGDNGKEGGEIEIRHRGCGDLGEQSSSRTLPSTQFPR